MSRSWLAFTVLATMHAVLIVAITVIVMGLPAIQRDLGLGDADIVLLSAAYGLAFGGLLLLGGRLADLFGRRRMLRLGAGTFAIASLVASVASTFELLVVARFVQGCGAALTAPAAMALVGVVFPGESERRRAIAIWGGLAGVGATFGTLLSGAIVTWGSWRWTFAIPVVVGIVVAAAAPRVLPSGPPPVPTPLDVPGALLVTTGVSVLSYGLVQAPERLSSAASTWEIAMPLVAGIVLLSLFLVVESRTRSPLLPLPFLTRQVRVVGLLTALLTAAGYATLQLLLSLYFLQVRGVSPLGTSAAFVPFGVAAIGAGLVSGRITARLGARLATIAGLAIAAAGLFLLSHIGTQAPYAGAVLAGMLVFPLGAGLAFSGATVALVEGVPDHQTGLAGGLVNSAIEIGPTAGLALLVSLAGTRTSQLASAGVDPAGATAAGYAFAIGLAAIAFALTAALVAIVLRQRDSPSHPRPHPSTGRADAMNARFAGKVVMITGGSSGIGRDTALAFAREGATVAVVGRNAAALADTVAAIEAAGGRGSAIEADVTHADQVARLPAQVAARHGRLDIAFNNAGILVTAPLADLDEAAWAKIVATNLTGVWLSMKHEIAYMREHGGGVIINMASNLGAHVTIPEFGAYGATKAAVAVLTRTAAREYIRYGIRINAVSPGAVNTTMSLRPRETEAERETRMQAFVPIGRVGRTDEVASAVLWLASPESAFTVGHDIVIDGGVAA